MYQMACLSGVPPHDLFEERKRFVGVVAVEQAELGLKKEWIESARSSRPRADVHHLPMSLKPPRALDQASQVVVQNARKRETLPDGKSVA
jgi:hypothetical protein